MIEVFIPFRDPHPIGTVIFPTDLNFPPYELYDTVYDHEEECMVEIYLPLRRCDSILDCPETGPKSAQDEEL